MVHRDGTRQNIASMGYYFSRFYRCIYHKYMTKHKCFDKKRIWIEIFTLFTYIFRLHEGEKKIPPPNN